MVDRDEHGYVLIAMPWKRQEMISLLDELSDEGEQVRLWVMHGSYPDSSGIDDVFIFSSTIPNLATTLILKLGTS